MAATTTTAAQRKARTVQSFAPTQNVPDQAAQQPQAQSVPAAQLAAVGGQSPRAAAAAGAPIKTLGTPGAANVWSNPYPTSFAAVPIAPPPTPSPYLTGVDVANRISEYADWDKYLGNIDLQAATMSNDTTTKVADIERSLAQNLDQTDWNMAARGLQASSIKDQSKAQQTGNAATQKGSAIQALTNQENFAAGEHNKFNTTVAPSIEAKYRDIGAGHKADADAAAAAATAPPPAAAPAAAASTPIVRSSAPTITGSVAQPTTGGGVFVQDTGTRAGMRYIVKNGQRMYESRPGAGDWGAGGHATI